MTDADRLNALLAAEARAMALLDAIEASGMIAAGRTELDVERDIYALAEQSLVSNSTGTSGSSGPASTRFASRQTARRICGSVTMTRCFSISDRCSANGKPMLAAPTQLEPTRTSVDCATIWGGSSNRFGTISMRNRM
jgi:hypothetical protein